MEPDYFTEERNILSSVRYLQIVLFLTSLHQLVGQGHMFSMHFALYTNIIQKENQSYI